MRIRPFDYWAASNLDEALDELDRFGADAKIIAGGTDIADETLQQFATRRLGSEAFDRLIDPMASGVFATG